MLCVCKKKLEVNDNIRYILYLPYLRVEFPNEKENFKDRIWKWTPDFAEVRM